MLKQLDILFSRLRDAEYAYLLLEPVPLFGLFFGLIFFAVGVFMTQPKCRIVALIVIGASCASVYPYSKMRNRAMPRALTMVQFPSEVKKQTKLRHELRWVYYGTGLVALLALLGGGKLGALGSYGVLVIGTAAFVFSVWMHMKEAQVYHPNILKGAVK